MNRTGGTLDPGFSDGAVSIERNVLWKRERFFPAIGTIRGLGFNLVIENR